MDNQLCDLKHQMILKAELETELKRLKEEVEKYSTLSKQRMGDIDQWKIKYGQLENRNSELMQKLATAE
jgi:prefoldin subunit 5